MDDRVVNAAKSFLSIYSKYSDPEIEKLAKAPIGKIKVHIEKFLWDEYKGVDAFLQRDLDVASGFNSCSWLLGLFALSAIDRHRPRIAVAISCALAKTFAEGDSVDLPLLFSLLFWASAYLEDTNNSKQFKRLVKHFIEKAVPNHDVDAISWLLLADAYEKRRKFSKAIDTLKKVIKVAEGRSKYLKFYALYSLISLCGFSGDSSDANRYLSDLKGMAYSTHSNILRAKAQLRLGQNVLAQKPLVSVSFFVKSEKNAKLINDTLYIGKANWNLCKIYKNNPVYLITALKCFNEGRYFDQLAKALSLARKYFITRQRYGIMDTLINPSIIYLMCEYHSHVKDGSRVQLTNTFCKRRIKNEKELYEAVKEIIEILGKESVQSVVTPAKEKIPEKAPEKEEKKEEDEKETAPTSLTAREIKKLVEMAGDRKPHWKTNLFKILSPFLGDDVANRILDTMAAKESPEEAVKLLENYFKNFFGKRK